MLDDRGIRFGRYRLHPTQGLTRGKQEVKVTPKSLAVLRVLLDRSNEVVTREELFRDVWPDTAVSDAALTTCIQELRQALDDDARHPRYIETLHRRGFRFVAATSVNAETLVRTAAARKPTRSSGPIVGRDADLGRMLAAFDRACEGQRQILFISGEPGIGKTALVDLCAAQLQARSACRLTRADCLEHHGAGEAYQPILDALTGLCTQPGSGPYVAALERCAPSWLAQLPALQKPRERSKLRLRAFGTTPERMLRELTGALETMAGDSAIVLCLEDLHWSDASTLDWIASFARRRDPARVMILCTYRPGEAGSGGRSPEALASDVCVKGHGSHISLNRLDAGQVRDYISARFPPGDDAEPALATLASAVSRRTEGNPLFVVNVLDNLVARNLLALRDGRWLDASGVTSDSLEIPEDLWRTIEHRIERLDPLDRQLLEAAGIAGTTSAAAAVAAGTGIAPGEVESRLTALARRRLFVREGTAVEWPDGTLTATFELLHSLYREVLTSRLTPARRVELHLAIGTRLEAAYGEESAQVAAELASHFERGRNFERAVMYLQHAADTDRSRSAHAIAIEQYRRALALLERLPPSDSRDAREIRLRIGLGSVLMETSGWGAPEVEATYARVRELAEARKPGPPLVSALLNLWIFSITRGNLDHSRELADRLLALATESGNVESLLQAHHARWSTLLTLGDFRGTEAHSREGLRLCETKTDATLEYGGHDTAVCARSFLARALALTGRPATAAALIHEAVALARALEHPFTLAFVLVHAAAVHESCRDASATRAHAAEARQVAREHGFNLMLAWATCFLGWSMSELGEIEEGIDLLTEGTAAARATGARLFQPHMFGLLARAQSANGQAAEALQTIGEALEIRERTGECFYIAELHRLRGEARLAAAHDPDARRHAENDFLTSARFAEEQGASLYALRTALSLARLWRDERKTAEAAEAILGARAAILEWTDLPDMRDADAFQRDALASGIPGPPAP